MHIYAGIGTNYVCSVLCVLCSVFCVMCILLFLKSFKIIKRKHWNVHSLQIDETPNRKMHMPKVPNIFPINRSLPIKQFFSFHSLLFFWGGYYARLEWTDPLVDSPLFAGFFFLGNFHLKMNQSHRLHTWKTKDDLGVIYCFEIWIYNELWYIELGNVYLKRKKRYRNEKWVMGKEKIISDILQTS